MSADFAGLREEFPILHSCTYLNSNSCGAFPRGVDAVLARWAATLRNWRDEAVEDLLVGLRTYHASLERFIGAAPGTVVTDGSVATLLGRLATAFTFEGERNRVVTTDREFPSGPWIWENLRRAGADPVVARWGDDPEGAIERLLDERVKLVCVTHGCFRTGSVLDVARVVRAAHAVGAQVIVDAYQTVGVVPLNVTSLQVDYLLGGAHKWLCGALDSAYLYVRQDRVGSLAPLATGWMAGADPFSFETPTKWAEGAARLASGTPALLPALFSLVGLDLLAGVGIDAIRARSLELTERIFTWAEGANVEVLTPRAIDRRGGVVSLRFSGDRAVAAELVRRGYVCSWRGGLRIAPHVYNTPDEVDAFLVALDGVRREIA